MMAAVGAFFFRAARGPFRPGPAANIPSVLLAATWRSSNRPAANVEIRGATSSKGNRCARRRGSRLASDGGCIAVAAPAWKRVAATVRLIAILCRSGCSDRVLVWPSQAFHITFHIRTSTFSIHPRLFSQLLRKAKTKRRPLRKAFPAPLPRWIQRPICSACSRAGSSSRPIQ